MIQFAQVTNDGTRNRAFVSGGAYEREPDGNPNHLEVATAGTCTMTRSTGGGWGGDPGTITIGWGAQQLTVAAPDAGSYYGAVDGTPWPPGTVLTVSSSAGTPPISAMLTMPDNLQLTAPTPPASGPLVIHASLGMPLSWVPTTASLVVEADIRSIFFVQGIMTYANIYCTFPGDAGTGSIPAEAFSILSGATNPTLYVMARSRVLVQTGGQDVVLAADSIGFKQQISIQ